MKVVTFAGKSGISGYKDGILEESLFNYPRGICLDKEGNLLVADCENHCIRKINTLNGIITTISGTGENGLQDGNSLLEAKFNYPSSLAIYNDIIYVSDTNNHVIRKIYNGIVSTIATGFNTPYGITIDNNGNILVADFGNNCIKRIDINGNIYSFPKSIKYPTSIKVDSEGKIYVCTFNGIISYWNEDDWKILIKISSPIYDFEIDSMKNIWIVEYQSHCIKKMNNNGEIEIFSGSYRNEGNEDGLLLESKFNYPFGITMNNSSIYISDRWNHTIRKINKLGLWNKGKNNFNLFFNLFFFRKSLFISFINEKRNIKYYDSINEE